MANRWTVAVAALSLVAAVQGQEPPSVTYQEGRLSVRMKNVPVRQALDEVARQTSVKITVAEDIEDSSVSAQLSGVSPEAAFRLLLSRFDAFFYYGGGTGSEPAQLQAVWVFAKGRASGVQPVPVEKWAGARELEANLNHTDPRVRQRAWDALLARPDDRSRDLLIQAIRGGRERDEEVRQRIFSAALAKGLDIPPEVLSELARADSSEQIRWMALDAASHHPSAKQVAEAAMTDTSAAVRQRAEEILTALAAEGRREGAGRPAEQQP
jgi:hypothetical protein